jgi:vacuolar-type H+-ATPase subunit C/Vma6
MSKLPKLKSDSEERKFWETHSISEYWDELEESDDSFKRPGLIPVSLKLDPIVLKKLKLLARKRGISYNAYIRYLLSKDIEKEIRNIA